MEEQTCGCEFQDPEQVLKELGEDYCIPKLACIPLEKILIPKPWNQQRVEDIKKWATPEILTSANIEVTTDKRFIGVDSFRLPRLSRMDDGKYTIGDGIHRVNRAKELGLSCILAWVTDCKSVKE